MNALPPPSEAEVLRQVLAWLQLQRVPHWRANTGAARLGKRFVRFGPAGQADILGLLPPSGRLLAIEVKRPGGRVRAAQKAFLAAIAAAGGVALVVHSVDELAAGLVAAVFPVATVDVFPGP